MAISSEEKSRIVPPDRLKQSISALKNIFGAKSSKLGLPIESIGFDLSPNHGLPTCLPPEQRRYDTITECLSVGEIIEPGNLGVQKTQNSRVSPVLVESLLRRLLRNDLPRETLLANRKMVTYNDKPSLYTRLGFRASEQVKEKYGTKWLFLEADMNQFIAYFGAQVLALQQDAQITQIGALQRTLQGLPWEPRDDDLAFGRSGRVYPISSTSSARYAPEGGFWRETCGFVKRLTIANGGLDYVLEQLFSNAQLKVIFGDGATVNYFDWAIEDRRPVCILGTAVNDTITFHSISMFRWW
jgi:hypothetical protein